MFLFRVNYNARFSLTSNRENVFPFLLLLTVMSNLFPSQPLYCLSSQNENLTDGCPQKGFATHHFSSGSALAWEMEESGVLAWGWFFFSPLTALCQNSTTGRPRVNICKSCLGE